MKQRLAMNLERFVPLERSEDSVHPFCELPVGSNQLTGICVEPADFPGELNFCQDVVKYRACIPPRQPLWPSWNLTAKDNVLGKLFKQAVDRRLAKELAPVTTEFIKVRFAQNDECLTAYKRLLCWQNFPSCESGNRSVGLCRTACESYHKACLFDTNDGTAAISPYTECEVSFPRPPFRNGTANERDKLLPGPDCTGSAWGYFASFFALALWS